jgi:DNA-binding MarR family transcriptional regulator
MQAPPHIKLLNLLAALRELSPFHAMSAEEDELLRSLLVCWHETANITVTDALSRVNGVSSATAYRRLLGLRTKGFVELRTSVGDKRVKFVDPTALSIDYANRVGLALEQL